MSKIKNDIIWSLSSNILPIAAGVLLIPILIQSYGNERFGLIAIAWSLVGYFGLFDMGLSRALTQLLSRKIALNETKHISEMSFTALSTMWLLGITAALGLLTGLNALVTHVFNTSSALRTETYNGFLILITCIPFVIHTAGLKGIMDALGLFKQSSLIRTIFATGMFAAPYLASLFEATLTNAMLSIVILRLVVWLMHYIFVKKSNILIKNERFKLVWLKELLSFGGWVAVSNIIGPLMVYLDRFLISSLLGAALVAFYVAPYEVVTKLWVIPIGFTTVLFPLFAREWQTKPQYTADILEKSMSYVLVLLIPASLLLAYLAPEWLYWWLDASFSQNSTAIAIWLLAGIIMNCLAQILFSYIQGTGRSDLTAKLHLIEAVPYWILLWYLVSNYQLEGAAMAWSIRCLADFIGLTYLSIRINRLNITAVKQPITIAITAIFALLLSLRISEFSDRMYMLTVLAILSFLYAYFLLRDDAIKLIRQFIKK